MSTSRNYHLNTLNLHRKIEGVIIPKDKEELLEVIKSAHQQNLKIWPISSGKNWGYGSALPVNDNNVILDLRNLNTISYFDAEDGIITIGPGVTQQQLYDFLLETNYICPSTGAGPNVSVLSNVLERGYGLAPIQDHFQSLITLKAFLADASEYTSPFNEITSDELAKRFKTGIGPSLNGIFTQSNFAVVTEITIKLARKPEHLELVKFSFGEDKLKNIIEVIKEFNQKYPSLLSGINLMNASRMKSMGVENPDDWTGLFSINANLKIVNIIKNEIKSRLRKISKIQFINRKKINFLKKLPLPLKLKLELSQADELLHILGGRPTKMALNLCYLKNSQISKTFDPDEDNCGLIWYSPLVKMDFQSVQKYISFINKTCLDFNFEPLITLTTLGDMVFDSTVPIIFSKDEKNNETLKAHNFYNALLNEGRKLGFFPYRMGVGHMQELTDLAPNFFKITNLIKQAFDPKGIMAPGRYSK